MISVTLTWRSLHDDRVCPICKALEGYEWTFTVGAGNFPNALVHPYHGLVWNTTLGSAAHGDNAHTCRCHLDVRWDWGDLIERLRAIGDMLEQAAAEGEAKGDEFQA